MRILLSLALLLTAGVAHAGTWYTSTIKYVYPFSNGNFVLVFDVPPPACTNSNEYVYVRNGQHGVSSEGLERMYAASLTAAAQGQRLAVYFDETSAYCDINRMMIRYD